MESEDNPIKGILWGVVLSIPLWLLIGFFFKLIF